MIKVSIENELIKLRKANIFINLDSLFKIKV